MIVLVAHDAKHELEEGRFVQYLCHGVCNHQLRGTVVNRNDFHFGQVHLISHRSDAASGQVLDVGLVRILVGSGAEHPC